MPIRRPKISLRPSWLPGGDSSPVVAPDENDGPATEPAPSRRRRAKPAGEPKPRPTGRRRLLPSEPEERLPAPVEATQIRVVLVEDVADVATHIREQLRAQSRVRLVDTLTDGRRAIDQIRDLHPDVVVVDSLLQGRVKAPALISKLRKAGLPVGIVALTVPDRPLDERSAQSVDGVVTMPFATFDLWRAVSDAHAGASARNPAVTSRVIAVFASKGGVGKTTIAYNLAAALSATGLRTILVDGSLQFGDVRLLLHIPPAAPSMCDLPTDAVRQSDVQDVVFHGPSGVDVLPAPPRPEMAELMTDRDLAQLFQLLRRMYQAIVIDTAPSLTGATLAMLDAADAILQVVTLDSATIDSTRLASKAFAEIGYPPTKLRLLLNRVESGAGRRPDQLARTLGRAPDYTIRSDWQLVAGSNAEGIPFVLAQPESAASVDIRTIAADLRTVEAAPSTAHGRRARPA